MELESRPAQQLQIFKAPLYTRSSHSDIKTEPMPIASPVALPEYSSPKRLKLGNGWAPEQGGQGGTLQVDRGTEAIQHDEMEIEQNSQPNEGSDVNGLEIDTYVGFSSIY